MGSEEHRPPEQPTARLRRRKRDAVDSSMEHIEASVDNDAERKQGMKRRQTDRPLVETQHYVRYIVNTRVQVIWEVLFA